MSNPTRDWSSKAGAESLAVKIREYWAAQGRHVETVVYEYADKCYALRSDMIDGMPQRRPQA